MGTLFPEFPVFHKAFHDIFFLLRCIADVRYFMYFSIFHFPFPLFRFTVRLYSYLAGDGRWWVSQLRLMAPFFLSSKDNSRIPETRVSNRLQVGQNGPLVAVLAVRPKWVSFGGPTVALFPCFRILFESVLSKKRK